MKKKRSVVFAALFMAAALSLGAGCSGEPSAPPALSVGEDGYVYVDGQKTDIKAATDHVPEISVGADGYVYVDGQKTDIKASSSEERSAFELWKEEHPEYTGTEEEWLAWLDKLGGEQKEETVEYSVIENGVFGGAVTAGTATTENGALKLTNAILRMQESVVLPIGEGAEWEVNITGTLLTGSAGGAQFFAGSPFSEFGRVYFGVNKSSKMIYLGVRINTVYANFGWKFSDASIFNAKHSYCFGYGNGVYTLSVDGGEKKPMSDINFNQQNGDWLEDPEGDAETFNGLVHTVTAQDFIAMTDLGANEFTWNALIEQFTVKTSRPEGYRQLISHPLANKKIFYLGSSITRGEASGGVAFGEIINKLTGNPFHKEAVSGTTLVDNGSSSYVQRLKNLDFSEKPDFLVVQLSTNDFSQNKPLGSVQDGTASGGFDTSTVSGAIQYIIAYAKEQCPTVKVVFYTGAVRGSWGYYTAYGNYIDGDFGKICEKWGIEPLDIFHTRYRNYECFWSDDIHPTIEGYSVGWTKLFMDYFIKHSALS